MEYLRQFENHEEYTSFTATTAFIKPNVSICIEENEVHFNPMVCEETSVYELVGEPSYPSTIEGDETSFDITFDYERTDTDNRCRQTVSSGSDSVTVEIGQNPSTSDTRTVSGTVVWNGVEIPYSLEQTKMVYKITYRATSKLSETTSTGNTSGLHVNSFSGTSGQKLTMVSHTFENGVGTIAFNDEVATIGNNAFYSATTMTSIDIPDSVTSIGNQAFNQCYALTTCTIGSGVTSIGNSTFTQCSSLTSIDIPDSVTTIGQYAFYVCYNLSTCTIGSGVTSIGSYAFRDCSGLTSIDIPDSVTSIGINAFQYCSSLTSCTIGSGVTSIGNTTFSQCRSLTSIDMPDSVTSIGDSAFGGCSSLTSIDIPSGVTSMGERTFRECSGLTSVTIPDSVTSIGNYAFYHCSSLTSITVEATTPATLGTDAFYNTNDCPIFVPCESVDTYKSASVWSGYSSRIKGVNCPSVTATFDVTDTTNPTKIAGSTSPFTEIYIDGVKQASVTSGYTFDTIGEHTVEYVLSSYGIGQSAFSGCTSLTSIDIPNGVTSIGSSAFTNCTSITSIDIPSGVTSIGSAMCHSCTSLTSCTIGSGVTNIGQFAFSHCSSLTSIDIPSGVTSIGNYAFNGCSSLTSITSNAMTAPTIQSNTFRDVKTSGTLTVPSGSSGYDVWMGTGDYYLGLYNWTKVEQ